KTMTKPTPRGRPGAGEGQFVLTRTASPGHGTSQSHDRKPPPPSPRGVVGMRFSGRGWGGRGYALGTTSALVVDFLVTPSGGFRLGLPLAFNLTLGFRRECLMNAVEMIVSNICERFVAEERMPVPLCVQTSEYEEDLLLVPRLARLLDTVLPDGDGKARIWWLTPYAAAAISE